MSAARVPGAEDCWCDGAPNYQPTTCIVNSSLSTRKQRGTKLDALYDAQLVAKWSLRSTVETDWAGICLYPLRHRSLGRFWYVTTPLGV